MISKTQKTNIQLPLSLKAWGQENFRITLKEEVKQLKSGSLPLFKATQQGGMVDDSNISVTLIKTEEFTSNIELKLGVFFNEIIGGCNCDDDPVSQNTYCEMQFTINKTNAETLIELLDT